MRLLRAALGSAQTEAKKRPRALDLCFSIDHEALRRAWEACPVEATDGGLEPLCAVLEHCLTRPTPLSISHIEAERGQQVLPRVLAYMNHAAEVLSAAVDHAELAADFGGPMVPGLPWKECTSAVSLLNLAARLFAQLAATPQYRLLLLQHEVPAILRQSIARLSDCTQMSINHVGAADGGGSPRATSEGQLLALLNTLQACALLLGCLWQAGFAVVHAPEELPLPTLPRLPDSVEELLRTPTATPTAALGLGHMEADDGGGEHGAQLSGLQAHALLRVLQLCQPLHRMPSVSVACWSSAARVQRLSMAAISVLLQVSGKW